MYNFITVVAETMKILNNNINFTKGDRQMSDYDTVEEYRQARAYSTLWNEPDNYIVTPQDFSTQFTQSQQGIFSNPNYVPRFNIQDFYAQPTYPTANITITDLPNVKCCITEERRLELLKQLQAKVAKANDLAKAEHKV